jgi:DNA recombination protein RmuC
MSGLSSKNYQSLYGLGSIDFVLMFIPIEPAFLAAIGHQSDLFQEALAKNIVLVCPSTLHATVRTIAHVWRQEHQNRNAQEIARLCGAMYDKFVGFVEDLDGVGKSIALTQKNYDEAYKKLTTGNGNLVRASQKVKELGVKPNKSLPNALIERINEE